MRKRAIKLSALLVAAVLLGAKAKAQVDPHYSQYYVYPSWLNPALTGIFDGDYRISGIYRSQWGNITSPFSTPGISFDMNTNKNVNFGASVMNQTAGDGGYNYTTGYVSASYTGIRFGAQGYQRVTFGMQAGFIQRKFNRSKLHFGDQWNPINGYNPSQQSAETLAKTSAASFDAGAGVLYYDAQPGKKANLYVGFSASHLTQPDDQFSGTGKEKIPIRYAVHAGVKLTLSDNFTLTPNALYVRQRTAEEKMIGAYGQLKANNETDFLLGLNYRFEDAFAPYVGFSYKNIVLGASYDITTSDLSKVAKGANSFEISLSFIGRKTTKTPEVEFVCPRL